MNDEEFDELEPSEQIAEIRSMMRQAMNVNVAGYDQHIAAYKEILTQYVHIGDAAYHELGEDLVVPSVGAVLEDHARNGVENQGAERTIFDLSVLLACAVDELIKMDHERIEEITK